MKAVKRRSKKARGPVVTQPAGWHAIEVGSIVLASAGPQHYEWFEVVVLAIEGEEFTVRYAEWPDEPTLTRSREQLALLHPAREVLPPVEPTKAEAQPVADAA